jgi:hypothetical protein
MSQAASTRAKLQASSFFLWFAWGTVAYFTAAMVVWRSGIQVPGVVQFSSMLSGAVVLVGAVVAAGYVIASLWANTRLISGIVALLANIGCLVYFWTLLP